MDPDLDLEGASEEVLAQMIEQGAPTEVLERVRAALDAGIKAKRDDAVRRSGREGVLGDGSGHLPLPTFGREEPAEKEGEPDDPLSFLRRMEQESPGFLSLVTKNRAPAPGVTGQFLSNVPDAVLEGLEHAGGVLQAPAAAAVGLMGRPEDAGQALDRAGALFRGDKEVPEQPAPMGDILEAALAFVPVEEAGARLVGAGAKALRGARSANEARAALIGLPVRIPDGVGVVSDVAVDGTLKVKHGGNVLDFSPEFRLPDPKKIIGELEKPEPPGMTPLLRSGSVLTKARNKVDEVLAREILEPLKESAKGDAAALYEEVFSPSAREWIGSLLKTDAEMAHEAVVLGVRDLEKSETARQAFTAVEQVRLVDSLNTAPKDRHRDIYRFMDGEIEWPEGIPPGVRPQVEHAKGIIQKELDEGERLGIISKANRKEHLSGLLNRVYDKADVDPRISKGARAISVHELFMRNDAEGLIINAPKDEVLEAFGRIAPDVDPEALTYLHQVGESTGIKIGKGEEAKRIRDLLKAEFPDQIEKLVIERSLEERMLLKERMDPVEAFGRTVEAIASRNEAARFFGRVKEGVALSGKAAKDALAAGTHTRLVKDMRLGDLSWQVVPVEVADFVAAKIDKLEDAAAFFSGLVSGAKEAMAVTPKGVIRNPMTNVALFSMAADVHPILNPESLVDWGRAVRDGKAFLRGDVDPLLKEFIDGGGDWRGIKEDLIDAASDAIAITDAGAVKNRSAFEKGRAWAQVLGASPHLEAGPVGRAAVGAIHGGAGEAIRVGLGVGSPAEMGVRAAVGAAEQVGLGAASKPIRQAFNAADPLYRYVIFVHNRRLGKSVAESMEEVRLWSQEFRSAETARAVNIVSGVTPPRGDVSLGPVVREVGGNIMGMGDSVEPLAKFLDKRAIPPAVVQNAAKVGGPLFAKFASEYGRIMFNALDKKPMTGALMASMGAALAYGSARAAQATWGWTEEQFQTMRARFPNSTFSKGGTPEKPELRVTDMEPVFPGANVLVHPVIDSPTQGLVPSALLKAGSILSAAQGKQSVAFDATTGFQTLTPEERGAPASALPRVFKILGGSYGAGGSVEESLRRAAEGRADFSDRPYSMRDALLNAAFGISQKTYPVPEEGLVGDREQTKIRSMRLFTAAKERDAILKNKSATEEMKQKARERYFREKEKIEAEAEKGVQLFGGR